MLKDLDRLIDEGYVSRRRHPSENLYILNYTPKTQYERLWNDTTVACRGLVVDGYGTVRARCFRKFFNYEEVSSEVEARLSSSMPFRAHEKLDGSLGILYWIGDEPYVATRGSFESPQALKACDILRSRPRPGLKKNLTYLLEIIYPGNRICVDYGRREDLVLLAAMDTESGEEVVVSDAPFTYAEELPIGADFSSAKAMNIPNREGFVVRFDDGYRFKIKFEEYVRLHSMIFSVSSRTIWNCLKEGEDIPLDALPDEVYRWVEREKSQLESAYASLIGSAEEAFSSLRGLDRREFARRALEYKYSSLLFAMLDGKPHEQMVWKMIEPDYRTPFNEKIQEGTEG